MEEPNNNDPIYKVDPQPIASGAKSREAGSGSARKNWFSAHLVLGIVFLVAVAAAIVAGIYYWQTVRQIPPPTTTPVHQAQTDPTANWQTYTNSQYGFSFQYPQDWSLDATNSGVSLNSPENEKAQQAGCGEGCPIDIIVAFDNNPTNLTAQQYYGPNGTGVLAFDNPTMDKEISVDGKVAYKLYPATGLGGSSELVIIPLKDFFIRFDTSLDTSKDKTFNQILSTFKFTAPATSGSVYMNDQYGFSIDLPDSWTGYTVLNSQWTGTDVRSGKVIDQGPIITLRHPLWTQANPREDMPVMVFTPAQWAQIVTEKMAVGAAPIPPSTLAQNSKYILALPARYNYDYKTGWQEVDQLVHTLKAYEPK